MTDTTNPKCCQETCDQPAIVTIHGPHGVMRFCESCAPQYEGLMRFMGCSTVRLPAEATK